MHFICAALGPKSKLSRESTVIKKSPFCCSYFFVFPSVIYFTLVIVIEETQKKSGDKAENKEERKRKKHETCDVSRYCDTDIEFCR